MFGDLTTSHVFVLCGTMAAGFRSVQQQPHLQYASLCSFGAASFAGVYQAGHMRDVLWSLGFRLVQQQPHCNIHICVSFGAAPFACLIRLSKAVYALHLGSASAPLAVAVPSLGGICLPWTDLHISNIVHEHHSQTTCTGRLIKLATTASAKEKAVFLVSLIRLP